MSAHTPLSPAADSLSAIIPVYNGAAFIAGAIESVLQQETPVAAIIVVDDCSTDRTASVVQLLAEKDSRICLLHSTVNSGPAICRNIGMQASSSRVAAFLDADDRWLSNHTKLLQEAFTAHPDASVGFCACRYDDEPEHGAGPTAKLRELADPLTTVMEDNVVPQSAAAVVIADAMRVGGYRPGGRYAEDYDLWVRMAVAGAKFAQQKIVTVVRMRHENQISETHIEKLFASAWEVRRAAVVEKFGAVETPSEEILRALLRAEGRDLSTAFHLRRRDLVRHTLAITSWIPFSASRLRRARNRAGWQWPAWRACTLIYDACPEPIKTWWRDRRRSGQFPAKTPA